VWARGLGGGGLSVGGVDLERVDAPERIGEGTRVVGNVIVAAAELAADGVGGKDVAGPVTTEGGVKNERHVAERGAPVAAGSGPCRIGGVPSGRVGRVAKHVGRDGSPREEPDVDGSASPFGGVHAAVVGVEARTIAVGRTGPEATAGVAVYRGVTVLAEKTATGTIGRGDGATRGGVKGHLVGGVGVDTFDDVDLSTRRPVWAHHPEGRPSATALRHMFEIDHDEGLVVRGRARQPDARSSTGRGGRVGVDANPRDASGLGRETRRSAIINDEAMRGITTVEIAKLAEKVALQIVVLNAVARYSDSGKTGGGKERREMHGSDEMARMDWHNGKGG
jgi:hypothetical protein